MSLPYDRLRYYFAPSDFLMLIGPEGDFKFFKVLRDEPMGQHLVQFANAANGVAAGAFSDALRVAWEFLEPSRQNRLFQARLTLVAIDRALGELVDIATIAPLIEIEWGFPSGQVRGGSDVQFNTPMNGIANLNIGGINGGRIPGNQIYTRDDPNEVFDLWIIYGSFPDFRVLNGTPLVLGGGAGNLDYDWYLAVQGRKYILGDVTDDEREKLMKKELHYRGVTVGGIEAVTTRA